MKRAFLFMALLLLGLATLAYPTVSNYLMEKNGSYIINEYEAQVKQTDEAALKAAWDEAVKYNQTLSGSPAHDPFLDGSGMAMQDNYYEVLNTNETMAFVSIPKIGVDLPVYHGTSDEVLHKGVGHLEGSSLPVGGADTHTVLTGHTGLSSAKLFTDLRELQEGDLFFIHVLDQVLAYQVDQIAVVEPSDTSKLKREIGRDYATLLTCTPYGVNSHRLLVRGSRTDYQPQQEAGIRPAATASRADRTVAMAAAATTAVMLALIAAAWAATRHGERRRRLAAIRQAIIQRRQGPTPPAGGQAP